MAVSARECIKQAEPAKDAPWEDVYLQGLMQPEVEAAMAKAEGKLGDKKNGYRVCRCQLAASSAPRLRNGDAQIIFNENNPHQCQVRNRYASEGGDTTACRRS
jgi:hypothetical protein